MTKGYLPKELPTPFDSSSFEKIITDDYLINTLYELNKWKKSHKDRYHESKCCNFSAPRVRNFRRQLSIPNPQYQLILCHNIDTNWKHYNQIIDSSKISISKPYLPICTEKSNRAFDLEMDHQNINEEIALKSTEYNILLKTDVSRFYPSIYSHSIPWAIHTKPIAKKKRKDKNLPGNQLDYWIRGTKDGQTLGIPVGPDTSKIIAEIIACSVDYELQNCLTFKFAGIRIIDDFILFFKNKYEAEEALSKLSEILREYELEINHKKTIITEISYIYEPVWKTELRNYHFRESNYIAQKTDLLSYFSRAYEYCSEYPDDNVMNYAVKIISDIKISDENIDLYNSLLLKSIFIQSSCMPYAFELISRNKEKQFDLNKVSQSINELIEYHQKFGNDFEIAWSLWFAKVMKIMLASKICDLISKNHNPIVVLIALDLRASKLTEKDYSEDIWLDYITSDNLYDDHWLLTYESVNKGWLVDKDNCIKKDPFYNNLHENGVTFYNDALKNICVINSKNMDEEGNIYNISSSI